MSSFVHEIETAIETLVTEPAFAAFAGPEAGILVWNVGGDRVLWSSPAAKGLQEALSHGEEGFAVLPAIDAVRLKELAGGAAPHHGVQLERLRLNPLRYAAPLTCACRLVSVPHHGEVLVTAIAGEVPFAPHGIQARQQGGAEADSGQDDVDRVSCLHERKNSRFVWQADADLRFTAVSPPLAETVGPQAADIVGSTWDQLLSSLEEEKPGAIAEHLRRHETWSGEYVFWPIDESDQAIGVELAGLPVFDEQRNLTGYRGFGLCRGDRLRKAVLPAPEAKGVARKMGQADAETAELPAASDGLEPQSAGLPKPEGNLTEADRLSLREIARALGGNRVEKREREAAKNGKPARRPMAAPAVSSLETADLAPEPEVPEAVPAVPASEPVSLEPETVVLAPEPPAPEPEAVISVPEPVVPDPEPAVSESETVIQAEDQAASAPESVDPVPEPAVQEPEAIASASETVAGDELEMPPAQETADIGPSRQAEDLLDLIPAGVLIYRGEEILFSNRILLQMTGYADVDKLVELGVVGLFRDSPILSQGNQERHPFTITNVNGVKLAVDVRLSSIDWKEIPAGLMLIRPAVETVIAERLHKSERDGRERGERIRELEAILAAAADGIVTLDETGRILSINSSGASLFSYDAREVLGEPLTMLLTPESHMIALDYLDGLRLSGVASLLEGGREIVGKVRHGGTIPLFLTIGRIGEGPQKKLCAILRDISAFKKAENDLLEAKRAAEQASEQKSDLLAKISHEIRTPLNAIIGFAEIMLEERFGPIGNERYKSYLEDMHTSGTHVMSLVNDLLDLAKIEAGHMDLNFTGVHLNELVASCVGMMQQQASRDRIVMRTSFAQKLPSVVADERSVRQIVLNLVSNAIKFTDAGGQVIVSTAMTDTGAVVIRVRDTGIGMDENDITAALEPFRQLATSRQRGGTGLGLPLTKALIEANRGSFEISSAPNEGTLVEVIFPPTRVLAE